MSFWPTFQPYSIIYSQGYQSNMIYPENYQVGWGIPQSTTNFHFLNPQPSLPFSLVNQERNDENNFECAHQKKNNEKLTEKKNKLFQFKENGNSKATRNIKANILKDFVKSLKKDATQVLLAKKAWNSQYSIKKLIETLSSKLPSDGKYIRTKTILQICNGNQDQQFSLLLRVVLRNFLKGDYINFIILKRKNKAEYLKACREIQEKLAKLNLNFDDHE